MSEGRPFPPLELTENPHGWGPCTLPAVFSNIPYQPFSKGDRVGKAAVFTQSANENNPRRDRFGNQYGAGADAFTYYHDDESAFQLVDTSKAPKSFSYSRKWQNRRQFVKRDETRGQQQLAPSKSRDRDRQRQEKLSQKQKAWASSRRLERRERKTLEASIDVQPIWSQIVEWDFKDLNKVAMDMPDPEDLLTCGAAGFYDRAFDKITSRQPKNLVHTLADEVFFRTTTSDDPHMRQFAENNDAQIFITDSILSSIMACTRSVYSWDIVIRKVGDKIFFDKRDESEIDSLTVDETARNAPDKDRGAADINSPSSLSVEATGINQDFSQQCVTKERLACEKPNPFGSEANTPSVMYRYRKWDLGDDLFLIVRSEIDGLLKVEGEKQPRYLSIKSINEYDPKASGVDLREKLDTQGSAVLASQLTNNGFKLARWTVGALLSGAAVLKIGYVTRTSLMSNANHQVLGVQTHAPSSLANQISLNMANGWGILRSLINTILKQEDGKFVLLKDPNRSTLRVYKVPNNAFEDIGGEIVDAGKAAEDEEEDESFFIMPSSMAL